MWNHFERLKLILKWKFKINKYLQFESIYKLIIFEIFKGKLKLEISNFHTFYQFRTFKKFSISELFSIKKCYERLKIKEITSFSMRTIKRGH